MPHPSRGHIGRGAGQPGVSLALAAVPCHGAFWRCCWHQPGCCHMQQQHPSIDTYTFLFRAQDAAGAGHAWAAADRSGGLPVVLRTMMQRLALRGHSLSQPDLQPAVQGRRSTHLGPAPAHFLC